MIAIGQDAAERLADLARAERRAERGVAGRTGEHPVVAGALEYSQRAVGEPPAVVYNDLDYFAFPASALSTKEKS